MLPLFPKWRRSVQAPDPEEFVTWLKTSSGNKWLAQLYSQLQRRHGELFGPILNVRQPPAVGELAKQLFMMDTDRAKWVVVRLCGAGSFQSQSVCDLASPYSCLSAGPATWSRGAGPLQLAAGCISAGEGTALLAGVWCSHSRRFGRSLHAAACTEKEHEDSHAKVQT